MRELRESSGDVVDRDVHQLVDWSCAIEIEGIVGLAVKKCISLKFKLRKDIIECCSRRYLVVQTERINIRLVLRKKRRQRRDRQQLLINSLNRCRQRAIPNPLGSINQLNRRMHNTRIIELQQIQIHQRSSKDIMPNTSNMKYHKISNRYSNNRTNNNNYPHRELN